MQKSRMRAEIIHPNAGKEFPAVLKFYTKTRPEESGAVFRSRHFSHWDGLMVFPDENLDQLIAKRRLEMQSIPVSLTLMSGKKNQYHVAKVGRNEVVAVKPQRPFERELPMVIADGPNFLACLKRFAGDRSAITALHRISKQFGAESLWTEVFICQKQVELFGHRAKELVTSQRANGDLKVRIVPSKVVGGIKEKADVDPQVMLRIAKLIFVEPRPKSLVLISGDGHYHEAACMWLGQDGAMSHRHLGNDRLLTIITARPAFSLELRSVANSPNVQVLFLEDLLG